MNESIWFWPLLWFSAIVRVVLFCKMTELPSERKSLWCFFFRLQLSATLRELHFCITWIMFEWNRYTAPWEQALTFLSQSRISSLVSCLKPVLPWRWCSYPFTTLPRYSSSSTESLHCNYGILYVHLPCRIDPALSLGQRSNLVTRCFCYRFLFEVVRPQIYSGSLLHHYHDVAQFFSDTFEKF